MGRERGDSVTDAWGRVHGVPWLRVADASLFPDSLEINPYLTVMALADRVAEGVLRTLTTYGDAGHETHRRRASSCAPSRTRGSAFTFGIPGTHNIELYDALGRLDR